MVIVGNLEMSMDRALDDRTQNFLSTAMKGAMRGAELTSQLLAFSRKQDLSFEKVELNGLVTGMREMLQRTLGETVSVETDLADNLWPINVDAGQVEGALLNLSLNACDAMPRGGRIVIRSSNQSLSAREVEAHLNVTPGEFVLLEVSDNGAGIAPEVLDRVFEPFFTTKDIGEGTGLGLSMVHGFVEQSGGFVEIASSPDRGTKVQIYLPRAGDETGSAVADHSTFAGAHPSRTTVLVVEDDPDVRDLVVLLLTELGCNIVEAEDGVAALRQIDARDDINLLFTDVVLPHGMSGPDVAREAAMRRPDLKIVFTSGYPDREIDQFEWNAEDRRIIRKPYRKADLADMLSEVMGT
jgi:two-component system, cell cycle sensor histidine kinase and response regulator CckA